MKAALFYGVDDIRVEKIELAGATKIIVANISSARLTKIQEFCVETLERV